MKTLNNEDFVNIWAKLRGGKWGGGGGLTEGLTSLSFSRRECAPGSTRCQRELRGNEEL